MKEDLEKKKNRDTREGCNFCHTGYVAHRCARCRGLKCICSVSGTVVSFAYSLFGSLKRHWGEVIFVFPFRDGEWLPPPTPLVCERLTAWRQIVFRRWFYPLFRKKKKNILHWFSSAFAKIHRLHRRLIRSSNGRVSTRRRRGKGGLVSPEIAERTFAFREFHFNEVSRAHSHFAKRVSSFKSVTRLSRSRWIEFTARVEQTFIFAFGEKRDGHLNARNRINRAALSIG